MDEADCLPVIVQETAEHSLVKKTLAVFKQLTSARMISVVVKLIAKQAERVKCYLEEIEWGKGKWENRF